MNEILLKVMLGLPLNKAEKEQLERYKINYQNKIGVLEKLSISDSPVFDTVLPTAYKRKTRGVTTSEVEQRLEYEELKQYVYGLIQSANNNGVSTSIKEKLAVLLFEQLDRNFKNTVLVVEAKYLEIVDENYYRLTSELLVNRSMKKGEYSICKNIPFANQPSAYAKGTGFFIRKDVIATAAHILLPNRNLRDFRFIKNYHKAVDTDFGKGILIHKEDIYTPITDLKDEIFDYSRRNQDWALIKVDKNNDSSVDISMSPIKYKQEVYCIGHGLGLPKKISYNGTIINLQSTKQYFECKLSTYAGNSGSPIFDSNTHKLVGMLIRGKTRIYLTEQPKGQCYQIKVSTSDFQGEECQKIKYVTPALNDI